MSSKSIMISKPRVCLTSKPQSPSTLRWRLVVELRPTCRFGLTVRLDSPVGLMDSRRYPRMFRRMKCALHNSIITLLAACSCVTLSAQDARLNQEDARLNHVYQRRVAQLRNDLTKLAELRRQETDWIKERDQKCGKDAACLAQETKARADYLEQLVAQRGANPTPISKIPQELLGKWIIRKVLPTDTVGCLDSKQAQTLVGTEIEYRADSFRWKTTSVQSSGSSTNMIGAQEFAQDNSASGSRIDFNQLGIAASAVEQITINHPDVKIVELSQNDSAAVPGENVLVSGPNTIIFDICNTYFEGRRE
jgi:uncharacterized protein YecT (DUF1311 family)